jgi:hypothetical protein
MTAQTVADGVYTLTWNDTAYACLQPDLGGGSPSENKTVSGDAQVFDLTTDYTVRTVRELAVDIQQDETPCDPCTGFGPWTIDAPAFASDFVDITGTGDETSATGSTPIYGGRNYTVTYSAETGYRTPSASPLVAGATKQTGIGIYITQAGEAIYASQTSCQAPCPVYFDAEQASNIPWSDVESQKFVWDFDDIGAPTGNSSEGFLAAHVFETAGTYDVGVTADGTPWTPVTITVTAPAETRCVNPDGTPGGAGFGDCPSASAGDHYTSVSTAWSAHGANDHLLLAADKSFSQSFDGIPSGSHVGMFGTGAKPVVSSSVEWGMNPNTSFSDLTVYRSGSADAFSMSETHTLVLRVDVSASGGSRTAAGFIQDNPSPGYFPEDEGHFIIDSSLYTEDAYGIYGGGTGFVIQRTHIDRMTPGTSGHGMRISGGRRILIQDNVVGYDDLNSALQVREGTSGCRCGSQWILIQGNQFLGASAEVHPQSTSCKCFNDPGDCPLGAQTVTLRYVVFERNHTSRLASDLSGVVNKMAGQDFMIRNNIVSQSKRAFLAENHVCLNAPPARQKYYNNTAYRSEPDTNYSCIDTPVCEDCITKNNVCWNSSTSGDTNFTRGGSGNVASNNWGYSPELALQDDFCELPTGETGSAYCTDMDMASIDRTNPDFMRPQDTTGEDAGDQTVDVWEDYFGVARSSPNIDVGAVEQ